MWRIIRAKRRVAALVAARGGGLTAVSSATADPSIARPSRHRRSDLDQIQEMDSSSHGPSRRTTSRPSSSTGSTPTCRPTRAISTSRRSLKTRRRTSRAARRPLHQRRHRAASSRSCSAPRAWTTCSTGSTWSSASRRRTPGHRRRRSSASARHEVQTRGEAALRRRAARRRSCGAGRAAPVDRGPARRAPAALASSQRDRADARRPSGAAEPSGRRGRAWPHSAGADTRPIRAVEVAERSGRVDSAPTGARPSRSRPRSTAAWSGSRCSTSASPTSGAARARRASTAPASSCTSTRRSASRCRTTRRAVRLRRPVSRDQLQPGDLVFFDGLGHNGIYIGGGQFIHARTPATWSRSRACTTPGTRRPTSARRPPRCASAGHPRRRPSRPQRGLGRAAAIVQLFDLVREVLDARRGGGASGSAVTSPRSAVKSRGRTGEALDLLEARALAVHVVDHACHELRDSPVVRGQLRDVSRRARARPPTADSTGSSVISAGR